jgi:plasmid segregation protein ParM
MVTVAVGIDVGYGHTKALSSTGASVLFPSAVGLADTQHFRLDLNERSAAAARGGTVRVEGIPYLYGEPALRHARTVVHPRDRQWIDSRPYRILWHAVCDAVLPPAVAPTLVTGLPVSFYQDRERLQQVVGTVLRDRGITGAQIKVVPQPFGSFFDAVFDPQGCVQDEARTLAHVGIVDVGYFTTDLVEVNELEFIQKGSGSIEVGVATVLDTLRRLIADQFGRSLDAQAAEQALRERRLKVKGQQYDLRALCEVAVREAATAVGTYVRQLWGATERLDWIVLTGGGGVVVQPFLQAEFPTLSLAPAPVLANARGFLRYALYCGRQST